MKVQTLGRWRRRASKSGARELILCSLAAGALALGCKDEDPCDPGQIVMNTQCYPAPASGGGDNGGAHSGGAPDTAGGAGAPSVLDTPFGTACEDTNASSDCAGVAPICADLTKLGQSVMCTQINCSAGEANAGVCPGGFTCFAFPGYPSVCTKE
jgi:hypothetical protein